MPIKKGTMMKKILSILISLMLISSTVFADTKDETVYINLNENGEVVSSTVVTRLSKDNPDTHFEDLAIGNEENLSTLDQLTISDDMLSIDFEKAREDFYYQSSYTADLPFQYSIKYFLDDELITAKELAGKSGHVKIEISVKEQETTLIDMMSQTTVTLDLNRVSQVISNASSEVLTGKTLKLSFVTMPGSNDFYSIEFNANTFEMESIMIALLPNTIGLPDSYQSQFDDMLEGFSVMSDGVTEMTDGTRTLQSGLFDLSEGLISYTNGFGTFKTQLTKLLNGVNDLLAGYQEFATGISPLYDGSKKINEGLSTIAKESNQLNYGYKQSAQGLTELRTGHDQLSLLAEQLLTSSDPLVVQLAQGILAEQAGLKELETGLNTLNGGYDAFQSGLDTLASEYKAFDGGINQLINSTAILNTNNATLRAAIQPTINGTNELFSGIETISIETQSVPGQLDDMIDGQVALGDGLNEVVTELDNQLNSFNQSFELTSFIHKDQEVNTLQILLKVPTIVYEEPIEVQEEIPEKSSIIDRLLDLFR